MHNSVSKSNWGIVSHETDQNKGIAMPPLEKPYSKNSKLIDLIAHDEITLGKSGVYETIVKRRSRRKFTDAPLTLEELSYLLLSTQGIINPKRPFFRTSPSGGARHGCETYIYAEKVDGLDTGLYRYLPVEHKLLVMNSTSREDLVAALAGQDFSPAVTFIWSVVPYRIEWRYKGKVEKLALLDVGHICQNLYLACEAEGMGTCAIGAYIQKYLDDFLGIDGEEEFSIYASPVGRI